MDAAELENIHKAGLQVVVNLEATEQDAKRRDAAKEARRRKL